MISCDTIRSTLHARVSILAGSAALAACLGACSRSGERAAPPVQQAAPAPATVLKFAPGPSPRESAMPLTASRPNWPDDAREQEWMRTIFGQRYDHANGRALAEMGDAGTCVMVIVSSTTLADGRIAVIVNASSTADNGEDLPGNGSPGILNVYLLERAAGGWTVRERHENLAAMGSKGHVGDARWVKLGPGKTGFVMSSSTSARGYSITLASIFVLDRGVRQLGELEEASDNIGACIPERACWDVGANLRFADDAQADGYADLLVDFKGKRYRAVENEYGEQVKQDEVLIRQSARYRFDGKEYVLVSGENAVPGL